MARRLGEAYVEFKERGMSDVTAAGKRSQRALNATATAGSRTAKALAGIAAVGAAATLAAIATAAKQVFDQFDKLDELAKTSDKLGINPQALDQLRFAFEQTGVDAKAGTIGIQRMIRRLSEAANKGGPLQDMLQTLGLDAKALVEQSPDETLLDLADAFKRIENPADRVRVAFKLFDTEGVNLVNTLSGGREALAGLMAEARRVGRGLITRDELSRVEQANDAINSMKSAFISLLQEGAIQVAPAITAMADAATNVLISVRSLKEELNDVRQVATAVSKILELKNKGVGQMLLEQFTKRAKQDGSNPLGGDPGKGLAASARQSTVQRGSASSVFNRLQQSVLRKEDQALTQLQKQTVLLQQINNKPPVQVNPGPAVLGE